MIFDKSQCLSLFLFLYGGIIVTLFFRAFVRRRLLKDYMDLKGEEITAGISNKFLRAFLVVPKQIQALRQLGKSIAEASLDVRRRYKHFQMLTWIAGVLLALIVIFSFVANQICG